MTKPPVVAVVNTNPDLVELLKAKIEQAGFVVLVLHVEDVRLGLDIENVLQQHNPRVVVYDVVAPYDRSWRFLDHLRTATAFRGRRFVLTSPNPTNVRRVVGSDETVYEILGQDADLAAVVQAVREASKARPTR